jgi:hypothetical protein
MQIQEAAAFNKAIEDLQSRLKAGEVVAHSVEIVQRVPVVHLSILGPEPEWLREWEGRFKQAHPEARLNKRQQDSFYYLFSQEDQPGSRGGGDLQEVRPGSGIVRVVGGVPEGPGGTLTCFLSSEDGRDTYFVAAGHVVSNFWKIPAYAPYCPADSRYRAGGKGSIDPKGTIYNYRKGFPATNSTRFLGKVRYLTPPPRAMQAWHIPTMGHKVDRDVAIVKLDGEFQWIQRTTCYGTFGEQPRNQSQTVHCHQHVMKCGAEETHWTFAIVEDVCRDVWVYGPDRIYELRGQVILREVKDPAPSDAYESKRRNSICYKRKPASFAVPGDSGTMVVDRYSKVPLGMLVAGSVLDGRYVMTPIRAIRRYWEKKGLVLLRA